MSVKEVPMWKGVRCDCSHRSDSYMLCVASPGGIKSPTATSQKALSKGFPVDDGGKFVGKTKRPPGLFVRFCFPLTTRMFSFGFLFRSEEGHIVG